jgi:predicted dehydrogenase
MSVDVRIGVVGVGGIAQSYLQVLQALPGARLAAIADPRSQATAAVVEEHGVPGFETHDEMSEAVELDAVLVCSPPATHEQITEHFLARRVSVLCEKPLTIDPGSARKLVELADEQGALLSMGAKFRYVDDSKRARSVVASGILGDMVLIENVFATRVTMAGRWNATPSISGGGVLIDNGTHSVDIVRYFAGPITEVFATEHRRAQDLGVEDSAQMLVRTADGVSGAVDLSWSFDKEEPWYVRILGTHGLIELGWQQSRYRQVTSPDWVVFGRGYSKLDAMGAQVRNFVAAVRGEEPLLITSSDAIASVEVVDAAYRSIRERRWVAVGDDGRATADPTSTGRVEHVP